MDSTRGRRPRHHRQHLNGDLPIPWPRQDFTRPHHYHPKLVHDRVRAALRQYSRRRRCYRAGHQELERRRRQELKTDHEVPYSFSVCRRLRRSLPEQRER
jgi:hypothetical protein